MWSGTPLFPEAASTMAHRVDALYFFLIGLTAFFSLLIAGLIVTGFSDLIGMRTALAVASIIYGTGAFSILTVAGRHVCDQPVSPVSEPEVASVA